ncbi:hypothetical protein [Citrobacter koseri]|uniref:hypothetical protein n=1 Tax=Citrobacter koseri TaxID=545 RepID=UPI0019053A45|nr:hypothetical protein [Citrobacter koseri]MBJ9220665.1 hypothetical protein [Citrobacter koseri]
MELTLSLSTVVTACLGFLGVYVLMPFALIFRDYLLVKFINKYLLNNEFWGYLRMLESDRAHYNYLYNKVTEIKIPLGGGEPDCSINGVKVTPEEFDRYEQQRGFHVERMDEVWKRIEFKNNIAIKIFKYFKLDEYEGVIEKKSKNLYESALSFIKRKEADNESTTST